MTINNVKRWSPKFWSFEPIQLAFSPEKLHARSKIRWWVTLLAKCFDTKCVKAPSPLLLVKGKKKKNFPLELPWSNKSQQKRAASEPWASSHNHKEYLVSEDSKAQRRARTSQQKTELHYRQTPDPPTCQNRSELF